MIRHGAVDAAVVIGDVDGIGFAPGLSVVRGVAAVNKAHIGAHEGVDAPRLAFPNRGLDQLDGVIVCRADGDGAFAPGAAVKNVGKCVA